MGDRIAIGSRDTGITMRELGERTQRVGAFLAARHGERVALVDLNSEAVALALFGSALARKPFVPINYRLTDEQHAAVAAAGVVGIPDAEWGEKVVAAVCLVPGKEVTEENLREHVRAQPLSDQRICATGVVRFASSPPREHDRAVAISLQPEASRHS